MAQKIFIKDSFEVKSEFKDVLKSNFKSEVQSLDFKNSEEASQTINSWCSSKTNGRIQNVLSPSKLSEYVSKIILVNFNKFFFGILIDDVREALIILVNAVYFNGLWASKFELRDTQPKSFYIDDNSTIKVDMMYQKNSFNYGVLDGLDAAYVELPYKVR